MCICQGAQKPEKKYRKKSVKKSKRRSSCSSRDVAVDEDVAHVKRIKMEDDVKFQLVRVKSVQSVQIQRILATLHVPKTRRRKGRLVVLAC